MTANHPLGRLAAGRRYPAVDGVPGRPVEAVEFFEGLERWLADHVGPTTMETQHR